MGVANIQLAGGFSPTHLNKYAPQNWKSSPNRGENEKCLKPPPRIYHGPPKPTFLE